MLENPILLSIVTPVYGCCNSLYELYHRLCSTIEPITSSFELFLINDHSPDSISLIAFCSTIILLILYLCGNIEVLGCNHIKLSQY